MSSGLDPRVREDVEGLIEKAHDFGRTVSSSAANKENILIACHHDADGISASAILFDFILRKGGHCQVRTTSEPSPRFLDKLSASKYDQVVFVDISAGLSSELGRRFGDKWLVIDHHEIPDEEIQNERILNPWQFGVDGGTQISSSGLCYFMAENNRAPRYSFLSLIGALGDRQDVGPRRTLVGLNSKILEEDSESFKTIDSRVDLLFWGKESRPAHESISNSVSSYVAGLTGNKDACLASLRGAGLELKIGNRWKSISNFTEEEKQRLLETIVPHLSGTTSTVEDLVGTVFTLNSEDEYSLLRDARDAVMLLDACGRMGKPSLGLALCLESRTDSPNAIELAFSEYRTELIKSVQNLMSSQERIQEKNNYILAVGDGIVPERMTGAVCQVISTFSRAKKRVILLRTTTLDGDVKVSSRLGREISNMYDLGKIMMELAKAVGGVGGGHSTAAGIRFSIVKQQEFQTMMDVRFQKP